MLVLLVISLLAGTAFSRPDSNVLLKLTFPSEKIDEEDIEDWMEFMKIVRNPSTTKEQKLKSINELMKGEAAEDVREALAESKQFIELNDWMTGELKKASPKVKQIFDKYFDLLSDSTFWKKTGKDKLSQLNTIIEGLNENERKELNKLEEANLKKAKELGILGLIAQEKKNSRR
ncbi:hypothetical protein OESDEN_13927 [Oesophagostomum dentatum]|uniref:SXP/RAL-2 family protein Ani s 5-like cation-binding domain-containing protein n=1 Tax=Oesophagostomum dentatum TaxID=61180 RepID=A0A0B1SS16_OESDE|nr:hypothetical protein OESDEN_13927 [Oesophagostomum dentatum]